MGIAPTFGPLGNRLPKLYAIDPGLGIHMHLRRMIGKQTFQLAKHFERFLPPDTLHPARAPVPKNFF